MRGKTKTQKGITLVALIITIVVLMILASVAISSIQNDGGILGFAQSAADQYKDAQQAEKDILGSYELFLQNKAWTQNGTKVTNPQCKDEDGALIVFNVGDIVDFKSGVESYDKSLIDKDKEAYNSYGFEIDAWRILGVENGHLLLVSGAGVKTGKNANGEYDGSGSRNFTISSMKDGKTFVEQMAELDKMCADYGKGENAVKARCITVEDINRITGYNPNKTGTGYPFGTSPNGLEKDDPDYPGIIFDEDKEVSNYGMKVNYKITENGLVQWTYTFNGNVITDTVDKSGKQYSTFYKIGENTSASGLNIDAVCDYYTYNLSTLTGTGTEPSITVTNVMNNSNINRMLKGGDHKGDGTDVYFLNNMTTRTRLGGLMYSVFSVTGNKVQGRNMWNTISTSSVSGNLSSTGVVRAVVYLDPDVKLTKGTVKSSQKGGFAIDCWVLEDNQQ